MFYRVHSGSEYTELYSFLRQFVFSCRQVGDVYVPHSSASIIAKITVQITLEFPLLIRILCNDVQCQVLVLTSSSYWS